MTRTGRIVLAVAVGAASSLVDAYAAAVRLGAAPA
jgi:hypothetical protein